MTKPEIDALISKWQHVLDEASVIPSWTEDHCLAYLAELASKSDWIIEMGVYLGRSSKVMLLANPNLMLYCVDLFEVKGERWCMDYLKKVEPQGGMHSEITTYDICRKYSLEIEYEQRRCFLIRGDSETAAKELTAGAGGLQVDAIWIDGGHDTPTVLADIKNLMPFLRHGGEMCGHDFDVPHNDVAQGVIQSGIKYSVPIPRLWSHTKP